MTCQLTWDRNQFNDDPYAGRVNKNELEALRTALLRTPQLTAIWSCPNPSVVCQILATFLTDLPHPLCTYFVSTQILDAVDRFSADPDQRDPAIAEALSYLPPENRKTLGGLMTHLSYFANKFNHYKVKKQSSFVNSNLTGKTRKSLRCFRVCLQLPPQLQTENRRKFSPSRFFFLLTHTTLGTPTSRTLLRLIMWPN